MSAKPAFIPNRIGVPLPSRTLEVAEEEGHRYRRVSHPPSLARARGVQAGLETACRCTTHCL